MFDEEYYKNKYKENREHYIQKGFQLAYFPNAFFEFECSLNKKQIETPIDNTEKYIDRYPVVSEFLREFPCFSSQDFFQIYGIRMNHNKLENNTKYNPGSTYEEKFLLNFDSSYYTKQYHTFYPYYHFSKKNKEERNNPNEWFDENFYLSFYHDVRRSNFQTGFEHYLKFGVNENRLPKYEFNKCLKIRYGSGFDPQFNYQDLIDRTNLPPYYIDSQLPQCVWFILDTLNPDIFFGGYKAFLSFIEKILEYKYKIGFFFLHANDDEYVYFQYHYPNSPISSCNPIVYSRWSRKRIYLSKNDIFISCSTWGSIVAHEMSQLIGKKFIFFIQEYESVFHDFDSYRFIVDSCYQKPHYAIFNSKCLCDYFKTKKLGVFSNSCSEFMYFEQNILNPKDFSVQKKSKKLVFYARPEGHAKRNLFGICMLVLKNLLNKGHFFDYEIIGFGAASGPYEIRLTPTKIIKLYPKLDKQNYIGLLSSASIGLNLMSAPHPGLIQYEMLNAGLVVVVNTFELRTRDFYNFSSNIIAADPTIESLEESLLKAKTMVSENKLESIDRIAKLPFNHTQFPKEFTQDVITKIFNSLNKNKNNKMEDRYLQLLKKCLMDDIYQNQYACKTDGSLSHKASREAIDCGNIWPDRAHTMIGSMRMNNIRYCVEECLKNNIPGDLIETGVWRGGACIFMKGILEAYNDKTRRVFVADSFEGLPLPDVEKYPHDKGDTLHTFKFLAINKEQVEENFRRYDLLDERVVFIKGFFEFSLKNLPTSQLAILRLDGDMYSSTIQVLDQLYDKLSVGGFVIIDDYGCFASCAQAVTDFRSKRGITTPLQKIDQFGYFWQKE